MEERERKRKGKEEEIVTEIKKKKPLLYRTKRYIIDHPNILELFSDELLETLMCTADLKTMRLFASISKRFSEIYNDPRFYKTCIEPKFEDEDQRDRYILSKATSKIEHDLGSDDDDSMYTCKVTGKTPDGIIYDIDLFCDEHEYARLMEDSYERYDESDSDSNSDDDEKDRPPSKRNLKARIEWFRNKYDGEKVYIHGEASFKVPTNIKNFDWINEITTKLVDYALTIFDERIGSDGLFSKRYRTSENDDYYMKIDIHYVSDEGESIVDIADLDVVGSYREHAVELVRKYVNKEISRTKKIILRKIEDYNLGEGIRKEEKIIGKEEKSKPEESLSLSKIVFMRDLLEDTVLQVKKGLANNSDMDRPRKKFCNDTVRYAEEEIEKSKRGESNLEEFTKIHRLLLDCLID